MPESYPSIGVPKLNPNFVSTWQSNFSQQFWNPTEIDKIGFALGVFGTATSKAFGAVEKMAKVVDATMATPTTVASSISAAGQAKSNTTPAAEFCKEMGAGALGILTGIGVGIATTAAIASAPAWGPALFVAGLTAATISSWGASKVVTSFVDTLNTMPIVTYDEQTKTTTFSDGTTVRPQTVITPEGLYECLVFSRPDGANITINPDNSYSYQKNGNSYFYDSQGTLTLTVMKTSEGYTRIDYGPNGTFTLSDQNGNDIASGSVSINQDGSQNFNITDSKGVTSSGTLDFKDGAATATVDGKTTTIIGNGTDIIINSIDENGNICQSTFYEDGNSNTIVSDKNTGEVLDTITKTLDPASGSVTEVHEKSDGTYIKTVASADGNDVKTEVVDTTGNSTVLSAVTTNNGECITITKTVNDEFVSTTIEQFNSSDQSWTSTETSSQGQIIKSEQLNYDGSWTRTAYDANQVIVKTTEVEADGSYVDSTYKNGVLTKQEGVNSDNSEFERQFNSDGVKTSETLITYDDYGQKVGGVYTTFNSSGNPTFEYQTDENDVRTSETTYTYNPYGLLTMVVGYITDTDGTVISTTKNLNPDGSVESESRVVTEQADANIVSALNKTADFLSLINSIKSGEPLPIMYSGLKVTQDVIELATDAKTAASLNDSVAVVGGALSIMGLMDSIESGDELGMAKSSAQLVGYTAQAFSTIAGAAGFEAVSQVADVVSSGMSNVVPVIGVVGSLMSGDYVGAAVMAVSMIPGMQWVGAVYAIVNFFISLFDSPPPVPPTWGEGKFTWNTDNTLGLDVSGQSGGDSRVTYQLTGVKQTMEYLIQQVRQSNPNMSVDVIAARMPTLSYHDNHFTLHDLDPLTGTLTDLNFDSSGRRNDIPPTDPAYFQDLRETMVRNALSRNAIAAEYEVDTVRKKLAAGDPKANLTELQAAAQEGMLAPAVTGESQSFRPVALDLNGDGQITQLSEAASGVAFDVDDSGFLKKTGWLGGSEGFLVIDRNMNDQIDTGSELFSNSKLADSLKGVPGLRYWDANYDGRLNSNDPVFKYMQVWQDANLNGKVDQNESHKLTDLGISELNFSMNTFVQNGQTKLMASADLTADTEGTKVHVINEGLLIESTNSELSLIVTATQDLSYINPGADGITIIEDVVTQILPATLLANDKLPSGARIVGVSGANNGTVRLLENGVIEFAPSANYNGNAAGFSYTVQMEDGTQATAPVVITVTSVNDNPVVTSVQDGPDWNIYGYHYTLYYYDSESSYYYQERGTSIPEGATEVTALFSPWTETKFNYITLYDSETGMPYSSRVILGYDQYENPIYQTYTITHDTPVASLDTNTGRINVTDIDTPNGPFTYEIVGNPAYGNAHINKDNGTFSYESLTGYDDAKYVYQPTGVNDPHQVDAFQVKIKDQNGGETIKTIEVTHYGPVPVPRPPSGGGGKPIAIDLNNDGLTFTKVDDSNVFYDLNNDGWREKVSWLKNGDGFLGFDADGNGKIEGGNELSFVNYKQGAQTDLEGLLGFDTNNDGKLTNQDDLWSKFGVWVDANQNGASEAGEFKTLDSLGIASIGLQSDGQFQQIDGNTVHGKTTVTFTDGHTVNASDVTLATTNQISVPDQNGTSSVVSQSPFAPSGQTFEGTPDSDLMLGTNGNTILRGYTGDDFIYDDVGNDWIDGGDGNDVIYSGADNDLVDGGAGADIIYSGKGNDMVFGNAGNDMIYAEGGNDVIFAGTGDDLVAAGEGNDMVYGDKGNDTIYGEQGADSLLGAAGDDNLYGGGENDLLYGQDGNDLMDGGAGADTMDGGSGNDIYYVDNSGDVVIEAGNSGTDTLNSSIDYTLGASVENLTLTGSENLNGTGNELNNIISGNSGANILKGEAGNDILDGGFGGDTLQGGSGQDVYILNLGGGVDTIIDSFEGGIANIIRFGAGISLDDVILEQDINVLTIRFGNQGDKVRVLNFDPQGVNGTLVIDTFEFADGTTVNYRSLSNQAPKKMQDLSGQSANEDQVFVFRIPEGTFVDPENEQLAYQATLANGDPLPTWLTFDAATQTFAGTPDNNNVGTIAIKVVATDSFNATADCCFTIEIANANDVPVVVTALADQSATEDQIFNFQIPANSFKDIDKNDSLTFSATLADGSSLPPWLTFDAATQTFSGTPENDNVGTISLKVTVADLSGATASSCFNVNIANVNDAPVVVTALADQDANEDQEFSFQIPASSFNDIDIDDTMTYSAILANGEPLPAWLVFDAVNRTFSGTPSADNVGSLEVKVQVTDNSGATASSLFSLSIAAAIYGTSYADEISALPKGSTIYGLGGDDILYGDVGKDKMCGGDGEDNIYGWYGDDSIDGGNGSDTLTGDWGNDQIRGGAGLDNIFGGEGDDTLYGEVDHDYLEGNEGKDTLYGGAGHDELLGGEGADLMIGGTGDDSYEVESTFDVVLELAGEGCDTVNSSISYTLGDNLEQMLLTGTNAIDGAGNSLDNYITGNSNGNVLSGGAGQDQLYGKAGNDILDGGTENDLMVGGTGNDTYFVDNINDVVQESSGQGTDLVNSSTSYTLTANVENLVLSGSDALNATGNSLNNQLLGNAANNILDGKAGSDTLNGGAGNDTLKGGTGNDTYVLGRGYGVDTIIENDATAGNSDTAQFNTGISTDQLWFQHVGNNLEVSIIGTSDKFSIQNWYSGSAYHVEQFKTSDGKVLMDSQVDVLVNAMAVFTAPAAGQTSLPENYRTALAPVIAANWQ
jgi:Ca2+-binding RTX toxin-like protein